MRQQWCGRLLSQPVVRFAIYVHEHRHSWQRQEARDWHLFVLPESLSSGPCLTLRRNLTVDLHEFMAAARVPVSRWGEHAGAEVRCQVCDKVAPEAIQESA